MFLKLLGLEWRGFFRSASVGKNLAIKAFLAFIVLYFVVAFLIVGFALHEIISDYFPNEEPVKVVNQYLIAWFGMDLLMRFMIQSLPILHIKPFIVQPIRKSTLINYLLSKTVFSWFNIFGALLFVPFTIISTQDTNFTSSQLWTWLASVLLFGLVINFLNILIQKKFAENFRALLPIVLLGLVLGLIDYFEIFSISAWFGFGFDALLNYPYLVIVPILLLLLFYRLSFQYLRRNLYLDAVIEKHTTEFSEANLNWTERFGALAPFLQLDMRLMWRNKRTKTTIYMAFAFLAYGLLIYSSSTYSGSAMYVLVGILTTGIFVINFGQFIPAWDSNYFSLLMAQPISWRLYLSSKVMLMTLSVVILTILSTPYVYYGWHVLYVNLACALYNVGVNIPVVLFFGSYNKKRIELDKNQAFNYQGMGVTQWIVGIPLMFVPMIIWSIINMTSGMGYASGALAIMGLIGLLLKNVFMNAIIKKYQGNKYQMIEGFNEVAE